MCVCVCVCVCVCDFRRSTSDSGKKFFLRYGSGKPVSNVTKELDDLQKEYGLPFINSSNVHHVTETLKGTSGLNVAASARQYNQQGTVEENKRRASP